MTQRQCLRFIILPILWIGLGIVVAFNIYMDLTHGFAVASIIGAVLVCLGGAVITVISVDEFRRS